MTTTVPQVDVNVPRFNQGLVAAITGIAFVLQWWPLVAFVAVILAATRFLGPRYGVFTQAYVRLIRPKLTGPTETEWAEPPRFAQLLGVIFLGSASVLFVFGFDIAGWTLTLVVTALAALAATTRICVGCMVYEWFATP